MIPFDFEIKENIFYWHYDVHQVVFSAEFNAVVNYDAY